MSVYTPVTPEDLAAWLTRYALGSVHEFEPIAAGIENTNYFLSADKGRYVLTLYERLPAEELPFYLNLMAHLARAGVMAPAPEPDRTGALWSFLNGKPAGLVARLEGAPVQQPEAAHCVGVGRALAELHLAARQYRGRLTNRRGPGWWRQAARAVRPLLSAEQNALVASELKYQGGFAKTRLPRGAIHGDLFCDNVLFVDGRVSGIIDFGFAATDGLAYDLAITVNDWCLRQHGAKGEVLDSEHVRVLIAAYAAVRPLVFEERALWGPLLRAAALRFWLSRLYDVHLPRQGELTHAHDPAVFERILRHHVAREPRFPDL
ncbi:MAG TPA: homoserine kinase [Casimicrobiaceae bacterium]|jgi:homoserine kinase type II|nr:homoserine kinase [Casimicrobiaceae bacterium]